MAPRLLFAFAVVVAAVTPLQARAAVAIAPCGKTPGLECAQIQVPLDRSGATPGTLELHVEVLPATTMPRGAIFLIAGGPGQGSARAFHLGSPGNASFLRAMLPGYTLVAFDNRGTGASGLLDCPRLQTTLTVTVEKAAELARACASIIGGRRQFYATRDHAEDIEAVRQELGLGKIALYGVSYGTKLALAYALAHPDHVERLLLDSIVPVNLPDPFARNVVSEMPKTLAAFCAGGRCRGATANFPGDVAVVADRLEAHPIRGTVLTGAGLKRLRMTGEDVLGLVIDSDISAGLAAELPAAVHAARGGYTRPLLRLFLLDLRSSSFPAKDLSVGLNAATNCADGQFPWAPTTPAADRPAILDAAIAALAPGSFGPFGTWAARLGNAFLCDLWPAPAGRTPLGPGPLPDVPVLALSGGLDVRTPTANALAVVRQFPQSLLIVVPGVGHDVLDNDLSFCSQREVRYWMLGLVVRPSCPRTPALVKTLAAFPRVRGKQTPRATLAVAARTVREAIATWALTGTSSVKLAPAGLYGGKLVPSKTGVGLSLVRYSIAPGVGVTGTLKRAGTAFPLGFKGTLRVSGPAAAAGTVRVTPTTLTAVLGGRRLSGRL